MPPRKRATTDLEEDFDKPVSIESIDALARSANVQENTLALGAPPGMHIGKIRNADNANTVAFTDSTVTGIQRLEVKLAHLASNWAAPSQARIHYA